MIATRGKSARAGIPATNDGDGNRAMIGLPSLA
jgi:hypothetical protein